MASRPHKSAPKPSARHEPEAVDVVFGLRAGLAAIEHRGGDVVSVAFSKTARRDVERLQRGLVSRGVPVRETHDHELERIAASTHHEGLCVALRPRRWLSMGELAERLARGPGTCIALDRVRNPYNIGAVLRSAAFFGVDAALLGAQAPHPALAPDAIRVAEGGVEHLALARTTDLGDTLARLRQKGVRVYGADGRGAHDAIGYAFVRPAVLVLGNEREGMSERVRAQCDAIVAIRGSGAVESLNVAVAGSVLIAELVRPTR